MNLISEVYLKKIFPSLKADKAKIYSDAFNTVFPQYDIVTPERIAAFIGQIAVESGELRYTKELPSKYNKRDPKDPNEQTGTLYEGRAALGNTVPGDGPKFIGRGILQLTGRSNYETMSNKIGVDILNNPELACDPVVSTKIACQYFKDRNLLTLADSWNIEKITEGVNGKAKLHHDLRLKYSEKALKLLKTISL